jgi:hypothetical protein
MLFTLLLGLSAFLVAGSAAYFSVLGIATLFSGSYFQVMIMAGALEFGKLVATSYLYRFWSKTAWWLKLYLSAAVAVLMVITSIGVFGYLSAAYQVNSSKVTQIDSQLVLIEEQKASIQTEIQQITSRIDTLNSSRKSQEQRLPAMSRTSAAPVYEDIKRSGEEIQKLTNRIQELQTVKFDKDTEINTLKAEVHKNKDIGTFKFIAQTINRPLDTVVIAFICVIIVVFDPLAVALVLAFNVATTGRMLKESQSPQLLEETEESSNETFDAPEPSISARVIGINAPIQ